MPEKAVLSDYLESANYIRHRLGAGADIAIILGSGLGGFVDSLTDIVVIPYSEIPHFPVSTVSYQKGELICGTLSGRRILCMNGRFHFYEGYEMWQTAYPIGVFKLLGVQKLIITNAAGGISDQYRLGDLVCVRDHIKFTFDSPVRGENIPEFGNRFFDMQNAYDKTLCTLAHRAAQELGISLKDGVYGYMPGPQFETPAEIQMLRIVGATLVGMSTVAEVIFAAQCQMKVLCISCVTNMAAGITAAAITEKEVVDTGLFIAERFRALITEIVRAM